MGIELYLLSTTLIGVLAQRLVRLNCQECEMDEITPDHICATLNIGKNKRFKRGTGCYKCHYSSYHGRITEAITPEISRLLIEGRSSKEISLLAQEQGKRALQESVMALARSGKTSIEEVYTLNTE